MTLITCLEDIKNIFYINLDHRVDRKDHVETQLSKIGFSDFNRFSAIKMANGAIGCSMSHLKLLQQALKSGLDHVLIVEDDIEFLDPELFKAQMNKFFLKEQTTNNGSLWDVILFAGNNMPPYTIMDDTCVKVSHCQTTTGYLVNGHYIERLMNNVRAGLTNLLRNPEKHLLYAIDMHWISLQRSDQWFLITPLTVVQREDYSDIEEKVVHYHKAMTDLDKTEIIEKMKLNEGYKKDKQKYDDMMCKFKSRMTKG
jgi:glycosyl transferase family 25